MQRHLIHAFGVADDCQSITGVYCNVMFGKMDAAEYLDLKRAELDAPLVEGDDVMIMQNSILRSTIEGDCGAPLAIKKQGKHCKGG